MKKTHNKLSVPPAAFLTPLSVPPAAFLAPIKVKRPIICKDETALKLVRSTAKQVVPNFITNPAPKHEPKVVNGRTNRTELLANDWKETARNWQLVQANTKSLGVHIRLDESNALVKLCFRELIGVKLDYKSLEFKIIKYTLGGSSYAIVHLFDNVNNKSLVAQYLDCGELIKEV